MGGENVTAQLSYTEVFEDALPMFLAIGVTYDQYWEGDPYIPRCYRAAYELQKDITNQWLWVQGNYNFCAVSTALQNAFRQKGHKAEEYLKEPLPIRAKTEKEVQSANDKKVRDLIAMLEGQKRFLDKRKEVKNGGN